jgi:hypothetical protein
MSAEFLDRIGQAIKREREHNRWLPLGPEHEGLFALGFKCVCCGKPRRGEHRREPRSEVCVHCVRAAGFRE